MFSRKAGGRLFHTAGPLYAKLRCPVEYICIVIEMFNFDSVTWVAHISGAY